MQEQHESFKNIYPLSNIDDLAKQRLFLEYLDSALNRYSDSLGGSNYYDDNGNYIDESALNINLENDSGTLYIRIIAHDDDRLIKIEYESPDSEAVEKLANALIIESLGNALGAKKKEFFRRVWFCYIGERLDGEYWLSSNVRVAPVDPEDPNPQLSRVERYISIDMNVEAIDVYGAIAIANNRANILAARLSLILNIGIYSPSAEHRWTIPEDFNSACELRQLGYFNKGADLSKMPRKGRFCKLGKFEHSMHFRIKYQGESTKLPEETRKLLGAIDKSDNRIVTAFDNCALLYQLALNAGRYMPTVKLSYLVAAIDALCKAENEFKDPSPFIRHYASATHNIEHLLDFMHGSVRSAHFHAGEFSFGEFEQPRRLRIYSGSSSRMSEHRLHECIKLIRAALANWAAIKIEGSARSPQAQGTS
ncbi:hypothetical protein [Pseudomonas sp. P9_31]|uniref:hypothetical protein n=1 Tax=Pseudomonas sp. P9_31 TaxID=3043448 RepID=UPI002A362884|nr:hypothetical protein [Pseudomonas sp. P9_31]WPN56318.1 hypothetical protein QMK51_19480 [Pseudomonas sp. P9_31]